MYTTRSTLVALLSLLVAVAAQHDDAPTEVPLDPGCKSFLDALDTNAKLGTCLKAINSATAPFSSNDAALAASKDDVETAFNSLCSSTACAEDDMVDLLTSFASSCSADLITNQDVSARYDMLYNVAPMKMSMCIKDGSTLCALKKTVIGSTDNLHMPEDEEAQIVMANLDAMGTANVGFLLMTPDSDVTALCSTCFQDLLAGYVEYEDKVPYALGVSLSPLLQGQSQLWQSVTTRCSAEVAANVAVKGGTAPPSAAPSRATVPTTLVAAAAAFAAGVCALAL